MIRGSPSSRGTVPEAPDELKAADDGGPQRGSRHLFIDAMISADTVATDSDAQLLDSSSGLELRCLCRKMKDERYQATS